MSVERDVEDINRNPEVYLAGYQAGRIDALAAAVTYAKHKDDCLFWTGGCVAGCSCGLMPVFALLSTVRLEPKP